MNLLARRQGLNEFVGYGANIECICWLGFMNGMNMLAKRQGYNESAG